MSFAAPVANGKFSFSVDSFYVETSGHNLHRRATVPELQTLFQPAAAGAAAPADPVGHWYEAQLLHYGIAPSKNKAVAKMRLLDAVRGGGLAVPKDISKIETDLKKEWKKKDKEAKSGKSEGTETKTATTTTAKSGAGGKRKRDGEEETETAQPAPKTTAKKTAAETNKKPASSTAKAEAKPKPEPKKTTAAAKKKDETAKKDPEPAPRGQTAKRGGARGGSTASSRSNAPAPEPEPPRPRKKQTARRSGGPPLVSRERKATPPPAYSEFPSDAVGPRLPLF